MDERLQQFRQKALAAGYSDANIVNFISKKFGGGTAQTEQAGTAGMEQQRQQLVQQALQTAGKVESGRYMDLYKDLAPEEVGEEEDEKKRAEQILTTIEDQYFGNQLHYGFTEEGIKRSAIAIANPNSDLANYNAFSKSKGVSLAKLAGDIGNIAWQEQKVQLNALATGLNDYENAVKRFNLVREGFGLPARDYAKISGAKAAKEPTAGERPFARAAGITPSAPSTGAPPADVKDKLASLLPIGGGLLGSGIGSLVGPWGTVAGGGAGTYAGTIGRDYLRGGVQPSKTVSSGMKSAAIDMALKTLLAGGPSRLLGSAAKTSAVGKPEVQQLMAEKPGLWDVAQAQKGTQVGTTAMGDWQAAQDLIREASPLTSGLQGLQSKAIGIETLLRRLLGLTGRSVAQGVGFGLGADRIFGGE